MYKMHYPKAHIDRLSVKSKEEGRSLLQFEATYKAKITLVNTQNVSVTKIVDSFSIQFAESNYDLRIQFLALVVMIHEAWLNA
jgi:hypothetical protein